MKTDEARSYNSFPAPAKIPRCNVSQPETHHVPYHAIQAAAGRHTQSCRADSRAAQIQSLMTESQCTATEAGADSRDSGTHRQATLDPRAMHRSGAAPGSPQRLLTLHSARLCPIVVEASRSSRARESTATRAWLNTGETSRPSVTRSRYRKRPLTECCTTGG